MTNLKRLSKIFIISGLVFIFVSTLIFFIMPAFFSEENIGYCGDGTYYGRCSKIKPYFCINETLIQNASYCGCPKSFSLIKGECISELQVGERGAKFNYILNEEKKNLSLNLYTGAYSYISSLDRSITYSNNQIIRQDFVIKSLNNSIQRDFLNPLLIQIYNIGKNQEERKQIAITLVQLIPYKSSGKFVDFYGTKIEHSRYPYEVLYENAGICGEKSELLAFLLDNLGYEVVIFYFPNENHEAVGIKCDTKSFRDTGYCYIETTNIFPIGIDPAKVIGTGKFEEFEIIKI